MLFFDNNATTPIDPLALKAMLSDLDGIPRNPSSVTTWGREARARLAHARRDIASFLNCPSESIVFTSGGTEGLNLAIQGYLLKHPGHVVTTNIEHIALLETIKRTGAKTTIVGVDQRGTPTLHAIESALTSETTLICLSAANNETGCLYPLEEIAELAQEHNIALIVDGVAVLGKAPIQLYDGITAMVFSGHKCHGPKGSGFVYLKRAKDFAPLFGGSHQENGLRAGTENLPAILGLSAAIKQIDHRCYEKITHIREAFEIGLKSIFPSCQSNGKDPRVSNTANMFFPGIDAESLLIYLDQHEVIVSLGSACSSGSLEPSHVLLGMGHDKERALSSLRFSFSRMNTMEEVECCFQILKEFSGFHANHLAIH